MSSTTRDQAYAALSRGDPVAAVPLFQRAVEEVPADGYAWGGLGMSFCRLQRPAEGLAALDRALALAPGQAAAVHYHRGYALEMLGRPAAALAAYRCALQLDPADGVSAAAVRRLAWAASGAPAAWPAAPPRDDSGRQALIIVGGVLLALVILVGGLGFAWWRITDQLARLGRRSFPSATPAPPPAERWSPRFRNETRLPRIDRSPSYQPPEIRIPEPPQIRYLDPPEIRIPSHPEIHVPAPPEIRYPDPPVIRIPEPPPVRFPDPPRFIRPEWPDFPRRPDVGPDFPRPPSLRPPTFRTPRFPGAPTFPDPPFRQSEPRPGAIAPEPGVTPL